MTDSISEWDLAQCFTSMRIVLLSGGLLLGVLLLLWQASYAHAEIQSHVIISEVLPAPATNWDSEWIELYNTATRSASISGWILQDEQSAPSTIATLEGEIEGESFIIVELQQSVLNNGGDTVRLIDTAGGVRDQLSYDNSTPDLSWSRTPLSTSAPLYETVPTQGAPPLPPPSPSPDPSPSPSPTLETETRTLLPSDVALQTLNPCPKAVPESLVFQYIGSDSFSTSFTLRDKSNNEYSQAFELIPNETYTMHLQQSLINNSGDELALIQAGTVLYQFTSPTCSDNALFTWRDQKWQPIDVQTTKTAETKTPEKSEPATSDTSDTDTDTNAATATSSAFSIPQSYISRISLATSAADTASSSSTINDQNEMTQPPSSTDFQHLRIAITSVILGGTVLLSSSGYGLYVWTETTLYPALQQFPP